MKRLLLLLSILTVLCGCKKHPYSPCGCIPEPEAGLNATVYPGLFFGQTREQIVAAGIFDSIPDFSNEVPYMEGVYGDLSARICLSFDKNDLLTNVQISPPLSLYEVMGQDSLSIYTERWKECITQLYGEGCFQRFETDYGWSKIGYWLWDVCDGGQYADLFKGVIYNDWHQDLDLVLH